MAAQTERDFNSGQRVPGTVGGLNLAGQMGSPSPLGPAFEPVYAFGPVGSRGAILYYSPKCGGIVSTGCFTGTVAEFKAAAERTHGGSLYGRIYLSLVQFLESMAADIERETRTGRELQPVTPRDVEMVQGSMARGQAQGTRAL